MRGSHVPDSMNEQFTGSTSVHRPESAEMGDEVGVSQSTLQHIRSGISQRKLCFRVSAVKTVNLLQVYVFSTSTYKDTEVSC